MIITEKDRDHLCDILWWIKGYKKGADDNFESCPFNSDHMDSLDKVVRELREMLNKPKPQTDFTEAPKLMSEKLRESGLSGTLKSSPANGVVTVDFEEKSDNQNPQLSANWSYGKTGGCIVSDSEEGINVVGAFGEEAVKYYGGHLIGESMSDQSIKLILAMHKQAKNGIIIRYQVKNGEVIVLSDVNPQQFDVGQYNPLEQLETKLLRIN